MSIPSLATLLRHAQTCLKKAREVADEINLATFTESRQYAKGAVARFSKGLSLLADQPVYRDLPQFYGLKGWGALLSFDLRKSSELAEQLGPRETYIVLHTYLPTMLKIVEGLDGIIVGLRGDGAIACFGLVEQKDGSPAVTEAQGKKAIYAACDCGDAMVKAMRKVVNPVLKEGKILTDKVLGGHVQIGVGIDVGGIVATRIGLGEADELTAYGTPVNRCCKLSYANDEVVLTKRAKDIYPKSAGGKTAFVRDYKRDDAFILRFPDDYKTLV